jgi:F0F1-type ATP synthase assembly protein I
MSKRSTPSPASRGSELGWAATSTMFGGIVVWGGGGWLLDHWWGTQFATPIGAILGAALGVYAVVMRYGRDPEEHQTQQHLTQRPVDPAEGSQPASLER